MANTPPRIIRQSEVPATALSLTNATSGAYNVEPAIIAETGQFIIIRLVDGRPYAAYIPPGDTDAATKAGPIKSQAFAPFVAGASSGTYAANNTTALWTPLTGAGGTLVNATVLSKVLTTNDGSNYWTATVAIVHAGGTTDNVMTANTSASTADTLTVLPISAIDPAAFLATDTAVIITISKTGSPGNLALGAWLYYQDTPA